MHEYNAGNSGRENQPITFKKRLHPETGLPTNEWSAIVPIAGLEIDFYFYEAAFKGWGTDEAVIDWEVVRKAASIVFENTVVHQFEIFPLITAG